MEYHDRAESEKKRLSKNSKEPRKMNVKEMKPKDVKVESVEKLFNIEDKRDDTIVHGEFLSESYIEEQNLLPIEVVHISHIKGQEKNLVTLIKFDGADNPAFVYSKWANEHCPQLVIAYYEERIRWEKKS